MRVGQKVAAITASHTAEQGIASAVKKSNRKGISMTE